MNWWARWFRVCSSSCFSLNLAKKAKRTSATNTAEWQHIEPPFAFACALRPTGAAVELGSEEDAYLIKYSFIHFTK